MLVELDESVDEGGAQLADFGVLLQVDERVNQLLDDVVAELVFHHREQHRVCDCHVAPHTDHFRTQHHQLLRVSPKNTLFNDVAGKFVAAELKDIALDGKVDLFFGLGVQVEQRLVVHRRVFLGQVSAHLQHVLDQVVSELVEDQHGDLHRNVVHDDLRVFEVVRHQDFLDHSAPVHVDAQNVDLVDHCLHDELGLLSVHSL